MKNVVLTVLVLFIVSLPLSNLVIPREYFLDHDSLATQSLHITILRVRKLHIEEKPLFSLKMSLLGMVWRSDDFWGYDVFNPCRVSFDIPHDIAEVPVTLEVWEGTNMGDISPMGDTLNIFFDVIRGGWYGEDFLKDSSGYGHSSGGEDGTITSHDYEIWFELTLQDIDNDGLTYWEEENIYHTNPLIDDRYRDSDNDGIPLWWEDYWGYDPFKWDDHSSLDPDQDGLQNWEEYHMRNFLSDPYRQDIYIEIDWMQPGDGRSFVMPEKSLQLLYSIFSQHHIMVLCDTGTLGGSDQIPYQEAILWGEFDELYTTYFLQGNSSHPRKGIFHYAILCDSVNRVGFRSVGGMNFKRDAFILASGYIQRWRPQEDKMILSHATLFMHELGHSLGLNGYIGIDNLKTRFPWKLQYWLLGTYKSCMNYRYAFQLLDYSDGTHGFIDHDDWGSLTLSRFES